MILDGVKKLKVQKSSVVLDKFKKMIEIVNTVAVVLKKGRSECVYQRAIAQELQELGIQHVCEETMPIFYKDKFVGNERADIVLYSYIDMIIELKAISTTLKSEHFFQTISYMRQKKYRYGMLVNYSQSFTRGVEVWFIQVVGDKAYKIDPLDFSLVYLHDYSY